jgi:hypothetical protein
MKSPGKPKKPITKLAAVAGQWKLEKRKCVFENGDNPQFPFGIIVSDVRFLEGEAQVIVTRDDAASEARILLGYRSPEKEYITIGIGGRGKGYGVVHYVPDKGWFHIAAVAREQDLPIQLPITISVHVRGQRVSLDVDGIRVLEYTHPIPLPYGQLGRGLISA